MKIALLSLTALSLALFSSCSQEEKVIGLNISNSLAVERTHETIELNATSLKGFDLSKIGVKDTESGKLITSQTVDLNGDGTLDQILFQPTVAANSSKKYEIIVLNQKHQNKDENLQNVCYSRFVPERTDDYTWENDKVAFRVYGPTAQLLKETGKPNGTLSSGVDAWLKKVSYPIINKWYKETTEGTGSYHEDTGEGLDNFHVGVSRGVGGIAVQIDSTYYFSKNYTKWRTITTGPLRTSFYLEYEDWDANGKRIKESKTISLDLGQNFSKFDTSIQGVQKISAGLTLHEKDGEVSGSKEQGWVSYWQPHADSELGTAIIASATHFSNFETFNSDTMDQSNAYAHLNVINNNVVYYAGFAWKKSQQYPTKEAWETYLNDFSQKINTPLKVTVY
ncbi:MAG: DUF4861 domain-containing protein [Flavicella sp.]